MIGIHGLIPTSVVIGKLHIPVIIRLVASIQFEIIGFYALEVVVHRYRAYHINLCAVFFEVVPGDENVELGSAYERPYGIGISGVEQHFRNVRVVIPYPVDLNREGQFVL